MINNDKLKFDKSDLKFFKDNLDYTISNMTESEKKIISSIIDELTVMSFLLSGIESPRLSARRLALRNQTTPEAIRRIVAKHRRDIDGQGFIFITANKNGYTLSDIRTPDGQKEIIKYFHKTQQRWKNTFNEIYNLMELLNKIPETKDK